MNLADYQIDEDFFDEMFQSDGRVRRHCHALMEYLRNLSVEEAVTIQERVTKSFRDDGIVFTVYDEDSTRERIIPVDFIPRLIAGSEWKMLEKGLIQRVKALNCFLNDIYTEGAAVHDGVIPADMVFECPAFLPQLRGCTPAGGVWVVVCGTDLVRTTDGFMVLEDNLQVPSGVSYMLANRAAIKSGLRRLFRSCRVHDIESYGLTLRDTLIEIAPAGRPDPQIAVMTPGVYNSAYYEHMFLAHETGASLVEGQDLTVRDGYVYMRTTAGLRRVDVIYRRIDDVFMDPDIFREDSLLGVPGLVDAWKRGNIAVANSPGTGVADDKSVYAYVPDFIRYYLSEEPLISNVDTRLCRRSEDLEYTLDNLENLVIKRVDGSGGYGMLIGPHSTAAEREAYGAEIRADPSGFIAQPVLAISRSPCLIDDELEPRHVDLRPFILTGARTRVVPGAFCRVALKRGSLVVNSSQGGGGKDLWVVAD